MANDFQNGRNMLLYIDTITPVDTELTDVTTDNAELVACLTSNGFDATTSAIATTSKCSGSFATSLDGEKGWTISGEGNSIELEDADPRTSNNQLFKLWRDGIVFWAFMYNTTQMTMRYGLARIDSYSDSAPDNAAQTFSISITGIDRPGDQDDIQATT